MPRTRKWPLLTAFLTVALAASVVALGTAAAHPGPPGVEPPLVQATVAPGDSIEVAKTVHTPEIPPTPDVFFVFDTTGSMGDDIATVQAKLGEIITAVAGGSSDPQFGVAKYEDFPFSPWGLSSNVAYELLQPITADTTAVTTAINSLGTFGGSGNDTPESGYEALFQALTGAGRDLPNPDGSAPDGDFADLGEIAPGQDAGFRADASKIILLVGDAAFHNAGDPPVSTQFAAGYPGASAAQVLAAQGDVTTFCLIPAELEGVGPEAQCTGLGATSFDVGTSSDDIAEAIIAALGEVELDVTPQATCDAGLSVSFDPATQTVTSGEDALFTEEVAVAASAPQGETLECEVTWLLDGSVVTLPSGEPDPAFVQRIEIVVPDVTPPEVACTPTTNPSGKNVPKAGNNPKSGQNPDGFYMLTATDNLDADPEIFVRDSASAFVAGPFDSGTKIKLVQARGAKPLVRPGPGVIDWRVRLKGDALVTAVDDAGNVGGPVSCRVPPPPK